MITLYAFGPVFGLPEASPYVTKTEVQLQMAGLPYRKDYSGFPAAPKGKLPYIRDGEAVIADSTFIRAHIERTYGFDFDAGYSACERALAWAVERSLEDHLLWASVHFRWLVPANFDKGPAHFFDHAPDPARMRAEVVKEVAARVRGMGLGLHSEEEMLWLAGLTLASVSELLGDKPYLLGDRPCGADATLFGALAGILTPFFDSPLRRKAESYNNLPAYVARAMTRWHPDHAWSTDQRLLAAA